jgi:1-acyl-sn-glycerol-3-phosphate acyltransferase
MAARLSAGDAMVLFAEGTSSNGGRVLPFRSALLGAVREALSGADAVWVQPVAIRYIGSNGLPYGRREAPRLAWYGDMEMLPHLRGVLARERPDAEIRFGAPVEVSAGTGRKELARDLEEAVRALFHERG